jgi:hypothetical protein
MKKGAGEEHKDATTLLMENSAALQRVLTDVAANLSQLNKRLEMLLNLFEEAAKNFSARKPEGVKEKEVIGKLAEIADQNRTIARGLMLLEQAARRETEEQPLKPKPLPEIGF